MEKAVSLRQFVRTRDADKVYDVEFEISGPVDAQSGLLMNRVELANKISQALNADLVQQNKWIQLSENFLPLSLESVILRDAIDNKVIRELRRT